MIQEFISACDKIIDKQEALCLARTICRAFGGSMIYLKKQPDNNISGVFYQIISDRIGCDLASDVYNKFRSRFSSCEKIYIPKEINCFRKEMAKEIYLSFKGGRNDLSSLMHRYQLGSAMIYRLNKEGKECYKEV